MSSRSSRSYVTVEEVYRRYGSDLLRFLHGANPHLNHQDCEDLLHEAVLKAVGRIDQWDPERGSLRSWVFGILRNEVRSDLRRRRVRAASPLESDVDVASQDPPVETETLAREDKAALEAALAQVPFKEREALLAWIRAEGTATDDAVAARLGISPGSVAVYRQRARERLKELLARSGGTAWRTTTPIPARTGTSTT